ncbi:hypothetical protein TWF281_011561 [Arthrobotrys megalospora]
MASLTFLPLEAVLHIYEECHSFTDAVSLSSSCKWLRSIWDENRNAVAFRIGLKTIPAFDDALITIRVTAVAKSNLINFVMHNEIPSETALTPSSFSYRLSKPTFLEVLSVLSLYTLIDCALHLAQYGRPKDLQKLGRNLAADNETWALSTEWLLPDPIRAQSRAANTGTTAQVEENYPDIQFDRSHIIYLKEFLPYRVYSLGKSDTDSSAPVQRDDFLPLAEYLIQKGREDFELHDLGAPENEENVDEISVEEHKQGSAIQQFMMLQNAYEILRRLVADMVGYDSYMDRETYFTGAPSPEEPVTARKPTRVRKLKLELFMLGSYQPETFTFPSSKRWVGSGASIYTEPGTYPSATLPVDCVWDMIPITMLISNFYPMAFYTGNNFLQLIVDSYFTTFCLRYFLGVKISTSDWVDHRGPRRARYFQRGEAFRRTRVFVPKEKLLEYPLALDI